MCFFAPILLGKKKPSIHSFPIGDHRVVISQYLSKKNDHHRNPHHPSIHPSIHPSRDGTYRTSLVRRGGRFEYAPEIEFESDSGIARRALLEVRRLSHLLFSVRPAERSGRRSTSGRRHRVHPPLDPFRDRTDVDRRGTTAIRGGGGGG